MKISENGIELIKQFEGCRLKAYFCSAGRLTIGYGHTKPPIPAHCIQAQADQWLIEDLAHTEDVINDSVIVDITQNQFDALCSLVFNIGAGAFKNSTLLKEINKQSKTAADQFLRWKHAGGKVSEGLIARRYAERKLFMS